MSGIRNTSSTWTMASVTILIFGSVLLQLLKVLPTMEASVGALDKASQNIIEVQRSAEDTKSMELQALENHKKMLNNQDKILEEQMETLRNHSIIIKNQDIIIQMQKEHILKSEKENKHLEDVQQRLELLQKGKR